MAELVGDLARGELALVQQGGAGLAEHVTGDPGELAAAAGLAELGAPPTFRIVDPIRSRPKWRSIDAGEAPEIQSGVQV